MTKLRTFSALSLSLTLLGACSFAAPPPLTAQAQNKALVLDFIHHGLEKHDPAVVTKLVAENMIQHNPGAANGRAGVLAFLKILPAPLTYDVTRVIADGDLVVVHSRLQLFGRQNAAFDVFRVANGQIVEHWDVLQPNEPGTKNPSGRTALGGETAITDRSKTAANTAVLQRFYADVFIGGKLNEAGQYFDGDTYLQHNPGVGDGLANLLKVLRGNAGFTVKIDRVARVVGEGNFVFVHAGGRVNGQATVFGDLYRLQNGKIAEHWDVIQTVPERRANTNGML